MSYLVKTKKKSILEQKAINDSLRLNDIETFKKELVPSQLSTTDFYLSIPEDYIIDTKPTPHGTNFYFVKKDTISSMDYYGGLYFGYQPNDFKITDGTCKTS
ncbi:hypothetical protein [Olleya sp. Bg11-27]|uniref:hypothetical protein n=1 Tax=Olleya sp. Bg11-27 TaxID=2058135 RepID=UPI000C312350|nr:hypothetical protein [Olleya sp. Bg11-27]AUC75878.1 hypothetical protein CW732_09380 [Olleya sp. Bg11-27]